MLGTIILDAYSAAERENIAQALDEICSPLDNYGWASAGVYCFWDPSDRSILYIGLSVDLPQRFREHNRLRGETATGNKRREIDVYFENAGHLGFSILVQSPMAQPLSYRALLPFGVDASEVKEAYDDLVDHGREGIRRAEGLWIEAHRQTFGSIPSWNEIGGLADARVDITPTTSLALEVMTARKDSLIAARHTLREIAADATIEGIEEFLHGARQLALPLGGNVLALLDQLPDIAGRRRHMEELRYLQRKPNVPGT
jgi:hypothetical protein